MMHKRRLPVMCIAFVWREVGVLCAWRDFVVDVKTNLAFFATESVVRCSLYVFFITEVFAPCDLCFFTSLCVCHHI